MNTLETKIRNGTLKRSTVEAVKAQLEASVERIMLEADYYSGFDRDLYIERSGVIKLNAEIEAGNKILAKMNEMGV